ncbi:MAG: hypothetical protein HY014_00385 [Acidobacteria bacterium]|nr:hypothetical protein [Acidobacteriota bacterium]MBI3486609.1 hypothetical protein [Acidobacteriota bacterium]
MPASKEEPLKRPIDQPQNPNLDLDHVVQWLRDHVRDVNAALAAFERIRIRSIPALRPDSTEPARPPAVPSASQAQPSVHRPSGPRQRTLPDADTLGANQPLWKNAYTVLARAGRPVAIDEIAGALKAAGIPSSSADFQNTVSSCLFRKPDLFDLTAPRTWGLVAWQDAPPEPPAATKGTASTNVVPFRAANDRSDEGHS